jgi:hypothetical protein
MYGVWKRHIFCPIFRPFSLRNAAKFLLDSGIGNDGLEYGMIPDFFNHNSK